MIDLKSWNTQCNNLIHSATNKQTKPTHTNRIVSRPPVEKNGKTKKEKDG